MSSSSFVVRITMSHEAMLLVPRSVEEKIYKDLDNARNKYINQEWVAMLPFQACVCGPGEFYEQGHAMYKTKVDLFSLAMDPLYAATGAKVRFDPGKYCPSKGWSRNNQGKGGGFDLISELQLSSIAHGQCCLVSNGGGTKSGGHARNLFCSHFRCHDDSKCSQAKKVSKSSPSSAIASAPLRTTTPHGDRNNSRGKKGKEMPRRVNTQRTTVLEQGQKDGRVKCPVHFVLSFDDLTFFLRIGSGCCTHRGHVPVAKDHMVVRNRLGGAEMKQLGKELAVSNVNPGQTALFLLKTTGIHLTRRQVAYQNGLAKMAGNLKEAAEFDALKSNESDLDRLLGSFDKKGTTYSTLYHRKNGADKELPKLHVKKGNPALARTTPSTGNQTSTNHGNLGDKDKETCCSSSDFVWSETSSHSIAPVQRLLDHADEADENVSPSPQLEVTKHIVGTDEGVATVDMLKYAAESRIAMQANDDQDVLLALVWITPSGLQLFRAYPEVMFIDSTHGTNDEKRPLVTIGVCDGDMKMHVVIRAIVPNERAWLFRWLFQTAIPSMVGRKYCTLVNLVLSDGDSQEISQLDSAISMVYTNGTRRRCGWHIVSQGWKNRLGAGSFQMSSMGKKITRLVKCWIYSFMTSVETAEEYVV